MVGEASRVVRPGVDQEIEHPPMEQEATAAGHRPLRGVASQIVTEPHHRPVGQDDAGSERFVNRVRRRSTQRRDEIELERSGGDRDRIDDRPGVRTQPIDSLQDRVLDRCRQITA